MHQTRITFIHIYNIPRGVSIVLLQGQFQVFYINSSSVDNVTQMNVRIHNETSGFLLKKIIIDKNKYIIYRLH